MKEIPVMNFKSTRAELIKALGDALENIDELKARLDASNSHMRGNEDHHSSDIRELGLNMDAVKEAHAGEITILMSKLDDVKNAHAAEMETARREKIILEDTVYSQSSFMAIQRARLKEELDAGWAKALKEIRALEGDLS